MRARLLALGLGGLLLFLSGCTGGADTTSSSFFGSAGVGDATIVGMVYGIVGGVSGVVPLAGVTVTAERNGSPGAYRTTWTDESGGYLFDGLPLGRWTLRFRALGFTAGSQETMTVSVNSGQLLVAPDFTLTETTAPGAGNVTLWLVDGATGAPVTGATVTVGGFGPVAAGYDGRYDFSVPVSGVPAAQPIMVYHPGYADVVPSPSSITAVAGNVVSATVRLLPAESYLAGQLRASTLHSLYSNQGIFGLVTVSSPQVTDFYLDALVDPYTGYFSVRVPPSTSSHSQYVDLVFTSSFFQQAVIANVLAPGPAGTTNLSSPVVLTPYQVTLVGNVVDSTGTPASGVPDQVVVVETGQAATPVGGSYQLPGVPVGLPLTLQASVVGFFGAEQAVALVTPVGSGIFQVPTMVTSP